MNESEWTPEQLGKMLASGEISREEAARIMGLRADRRAESEKERILAAVRSGNVEEVMAPRGKRKPVATRVTTYALSFMAALGILLAVFYILLFVIKQRL